MWRAPNTLTFLVFKIPGLPDHDPYFEGFGWRQLKVFWLEHRASDLWLEDVQPHVEKAWRKKRNR